MSLLKKITERHPEGTKFLSSQNVTFMILILSQLLRKKTQKEPVILHHYA